nr:MAG TPA: hypothetical protein [Caudoviricetes sp.]
MVTLSHTFRVQFLEYLTTEFCVSKISLTFKN